MAQLSFSPTSSTPSGFDDIGSTGFPVHCEHTRVPMSFNGLCGSQLIASKINDIVYGIAMVMVSQYFRFHSAGDSRLVKGTVALLTISATLQAVFANAQTYDYFVLKFSRADLFILVTYSAIGKYVTIYFTAFVAQMFYATRIYSITRYMPTRLRLLTIPVVVLALLQIVAGFTVVIFMMKAKSYSNFRLFPSRIFIVIQGVAAAACDISITLSFSLIVKANRSGMRSRTHNLLNKLIVYAVNRAAATSVCSLLGVSMFWYISGTYYYMIPLVANTHIYVISVISVLSTRGALREDYSIHLSDIYIPSNSVDNRHGRYVPKETEADLQKGANHLIMQV